jgi:hypothetical protein
MDYTSQHRSKLADPVRISKSQLERGQVLKVRYRKVDTTMDDYFVFVLQPKYKGYFHCLDLKVIQPTLMVKLAEDLDESYCTGARVKKLDLTKLLITESSKGFYIGNIRHKKLQVGYRTFLEKNLMSIIAYNYDYGVFDKIATRAEKRRDEGIRRDDKDAMGTYTG